MCGRFASSADRDQLVEAFLIDQVQTEHASGAQADQPEVWLGPRWNIAPTDTVATVIERGEQPTRRLAGLRWGLVPSWSKGPGTRPALINARLEGLDEKPSFRKALVARRCLVPADGYYEWTPAEGGRQPWFIRPVDSGPGMMAMAGLYEFWKDPASTGRESDWLVSMAIITAPATDDLGRVHDRMPVQIAPSDRDDWLDPALVDPQHALGLVHVPAAGEMTAFQVSRRVNSIAHQGPELVDPLPTRESQR